MDQCPAYALDIGGPLATRGRGTGGSGGTLPPQFGSRGGCAPTAVHRARNRWAVVVPKLGVVGHKGKLNGMKHFRKNLSLSLARQLIWQINLYSRLPQRYFLRLPENECLTCLQLFSFFVLFSFR